VDEGEGQNSLTQVLAGGQRSEGRSSSSTDLRLVVMGTGGLASKILTSLLSAGESVVGVCCHLEKRRRESVRGPIGQLKQRVKSRMVYWGLYSSPSFSYVLPFDGLETPADIAETQGVKVLDVRDLKRPAFEDSLSALRPDLIVVAGFPRLIPSNVLAIPKIGIVNFHPSLLPKHRGGTPNRWVIRNGETETGVTVHLVSDEYDAGDIVAQEKIAVRPHETWGDLERRSADLSAHMVHDVLEMARKGALAGTAQAHHESTHEPSYKGRHAHIDWRLPAAEVRQTCYAIRPLSGGMASFKGRPVCIWDLEASAQGPMYEAPGTITDIGDDRGITVACGLGTVVIHSFLQSGTLLPARKFVERLGMRPEMVFDESAAQEDD
jgi:methionyl-tRNA formyltransferase